MSSLFRIIKLSRGRGGVVLSASSSISFVVHSQLRPAAQQAYFCFFQVNSKTLSFGIGVSSPEWLQQSDPIT